MLDTRPPAIESLAHPAVNLKAVTPHALAYYQNVQWACTHGYTLLYFELAGQGCSHPLWGARVSQLISIRVLRISRRLRSPLTQRPPERESRIRSTRATASSRRCRTCLTCPEDTSGPSSWTAMRCFGTRRTSRCPSCSDAIAAAPPTTAAAANALHATARRERSPPSSLDGTRRTRSARTRAASPCATHPGRERSGGCGGRSSTVRTAHTVTLSPSPSPSPQVLRLWWSLDHGPYGLSHPFEQQALQWQLMHMCDPVPSPRDPRPSACEPEPEPSLSLSSSPSDPRPHPHTLNLALTLALALTLTRRGPCPLILTLTRRGPRPLTLTITLTLTRRAPRPLIETLRLRALDPLAPDAVSHLDHNVGTRARVWGLTLALSLALSPSPSPSPSPSRPHPRPRPHPHPGMGSGSSGR